MKTFNAPEMELVKLTVKDVVSTSSEAETTIKPTTGGVGF